MHTYVVVRLAGKDKALEYKPREHEGVGNGGVKSLRISFANACRTPERATNFLMDPSAKEGVK